MNCLLYARVSADRQAQKELSITESRIDGDEKKKTTLRVFGDSVVEFRKAIDDDAASVSQA